MVPICVGRLLVSPAVLLEKRLVKRIALACAHAHWRQHTQHHHWRGQRLRTGARARARAPRRQAGAFGHQSARGGRDGATAAHKARAKVIALACDVTQIAQVEALAKKAGGVFDLVVNNAGVSSGGLIGELSLEDWRFTLAGRSLHGRHPWLLMCSRRSWRAQKHGHILNVASAAGLACLPRMAAYNVAKAGVIALSDTLYSELVGSGVGVTVLCPTFFKTNIVISGRFADPSLRKAAAKMIEGGTTAEAVALKTLRAIERNDRYCLPMADARWMWRLQRLVPGIVSSVAGRLEKRRRQ